jgi:hypothetical protein
MYKYIYVYISYIHIIYVCMYECMFEYIYYWYKETLMSCNNNTQRSFERMAADFEKEFERVEFARVPAEEALSDYSSNPPPPQSVTPPPPSTIAQGAFDAEEAQSDAASFVTWDHIPVFEAQSDTASVVTTGQWDHIPLFEAQSDTASVVTTGQWEHIPVFEAEVSPRHDTPSTIQPEASVLMW